MKRISKLVLCSGEHDYKKPLRAPTPRSALPWLPSWIGCNGAIILIILYLEEIPWNMSTQSKFDQELNTQLQDEAFLEVPVDDFAIALQTAIPLRFTLLDCKTMSGNAFAT